jgi:serine/threonine protein kinase
MGNSCFRNYDDDDEITYNNIKIASGMKYLEGCRCVHRYLAARNILVGERNIVKIADFGFAQMLNKEEKLELSQEESKSLIFILLLFL